jgi:hypothetical protein
VEQHVEEPSSELEPEPLDRRLRIGVIEIVLALRETGADRDLMAAVLSRLELEELHQDSRFTDSLKQMRRGERAA